MYTNPLKIKQNFGILKIFLGGEISPFRTVWVQGQIPRSVQSSLDQHRLQKVTESPEQAQRL